MINTYVIRPYEVRAVQWTGDNVDEISKFINKKCVPIDYYKDYAYLPNLCIVMQDSFSIISAGDYVFKISDYSSDFSTMKAEDFEKKYEPK